jgi:hypothetical protein
MNDKSQVLRKLFCESVEAEFSFLEGRYGFSRTEVGPRAIRYSSPTVHVTVYYGRIYDLGVTIGLAPLPEPEKPGRFSLSRLFSPKHARNLPSEEYLALSRDQASPYYHPSIIGALGEPGGVPPAKWPPQPGPLAFFAEDESRVQSGVSKLAELIRQFADPLLRGDLTAFRKVSDYAHAEAEALARAMLLKELPAEVAAELRSASVPELYRARDESLKKKVLAEHPEEFGIWRDLPAKEFMMRYFEKKNPHVSEKVIGARRK